MAAPGSLILAAIDPAKKALDDAVDNVAGLMMQVQTQMRHLSLPEKADLYLRLSDLAVLTNSCGRAIQDEIKKLSTKHIPEAMEADGLDTFTDKSLKKRFSISVNYSARQVDKDGLYKWLREIDSADIIKPTVNSSSLTALLRNRAEDGEPDPPDGTAILNVTKSLRVTSL